LTTRERVQVFEEEILLQSESGRQSRHLGLGFVTAAFAEVLFEGREAMNGLIGRVGGEFVARVLHIGVELVEAPRTQHVTQSNRFDAEPAGHRLLG